MDYRGIFPHRMAAVSGHALTSISAMWEYILTTLLSCLPGVMLVSTMERKPVKSPSIQLILDLYNVTYVSNDNVMDRTFLLDNHLTPLLLGNEGKGGRLRPLTECMYATELW